MTQFAGKAIIITGAGGGLGSAMARLMAERGGMVIVADIALDRAKQVADSIVAAGGQAIGVEADVTQEASVEAMVAATVAAFGGVDVLVNNANESRPEISALDCKPLTEFDPEALDAFVAVNLRGAMFCCKYAIREMLKRGGGSIVNIASTAGIKGGNALHAYGASKAGLISLTRHIAVAYGKRDIRCNAVAPGTTVHDRMKDLVSANVLTTDGVLTTRLGRPEDIAHAVAYLASDDAGYVTGQVLPVDGGSTVPAITQKAAA